MEKSSPYRTSWFGGGRFRTIIAAAAVAALALSAGVPTRAQTTQRNYIQLENAKPGDAGWKLTKPGYTSGVIEGYASATSVNRGETIRLYVNTSEPSYTIDVYRMGYYGGAGARKMLTVTLPGTAQAACPMDAFGTVECNWINPYSLSIPASADPTDWMSGMYIAKLTSGATKTQQYLIFTVRDDTRFSDILMIQAVNTYEAYNVWGGKSLYGTVTNRDDTANKAVKVSFNRPYYADGGYGTASFFTATYLGNELNMLTWLEQQGYDVSYATDVDLDNNPNAVLNHKVLQIVGHSEYWSWAMRDNVDRAVQAGVNFASIAGNVSYWQIRYENSAVTGDPSRTIVGYKELVSQDPMASTQYATTLWRKAPVNRSEDRMTGTMYITQARPSLCIEDESHWLLTGTGLKNGQCLLNPDGTTFLGYEIDSMGPATPASFQRVGHSPATAAYANFADMGVWRAPSGATVFTTGSIGWSEVATQTQQILRNVYQRMLNGAFPDATPVRPSPPAPFRAQDVGAVARPGFVALSGPASFRINGDGLDIASGNDGLFYVYQPWTGDGQMKIRMNTLQEYWGNQAGIMIRESLDPKARYVSLSGRPSEGMTQGADFRAKSTYGAAPAKLASVDLKGPTWLDVVRVGSTFYAFTSNDGVNWTSLGSTTLALNSAVYVGAYVASAQRNVWMTADFDQVSVTGDTTLPATPPPDTTPPSVSITSPANGATVSGVVSITATASDNVGVAGVQLKVDGASVGAEDTASPYSFSWDSAAVSTGNHILTAVARDAAGNTATSAAITVTVAASASTLPSGWAHQDIGAVGLTGSASYDAPTQTFTVRGAGADVWNSADAFQFAYTTLNGDGTIVARVKTVSAEAAWVKAGVMLRETLDPSSKHAFMLVSSSKGLAFQRRTTTAGASTSTAGSLSTAPRWVRLDRKGGTLTAYESADGSVWTLVGSDTITMATQIYAGLAVSSHTTAALSTATIDSVSIAAAQPPSDVTPPTVAITSPANGATVSGSVVITATASDNVGVAGVQFKVDGVSVGTEDTASPYSFTWDASSATAGNHVLTAVARDAAGNSATSPGVSVTVSAQSSSLPAGWSARDIGAVGIVGSTSYTTTGATFTVKGAGADIWDTADAFQFAYTTLSGDGTIVARVATVSTEAAWVKVGVMLRETLDPSSKHALMLVSNARGLAFQRRTATGGLSTSTAGGSFTAPRWVRLDRAGSTLTAYQSADGRSWTLVGSDTIPMATQIYAGLAVSSHTTTALATGTIDSVSVTQAAPPPITGACPSVTISPSSFYSGAPAATWTVTVTAPTSSCTWNASVDQPWITLNGAAGPLTISGTGSATLRLGTLDNKTGVMRYGTFTIAGASYKVTQEY